MHIKIEAAYQSLNHSKEELCGDKVEILETEDSYSIILADGMGSGVKANILATLTSKILGTMMLKGASLEECVDTIVKTLPECSERHVAYSTFSILQITEAGKGKLVEFDNPSCIFIRDNHLVPYEYQVWEMEGKSIKVAEFDVKLSDTFLLVSDGVVHAGIGQILSFGWGWNNAAEFAVNEVESESDIPAWKLAKVLSETAESLYLKNPGDDTTVAVARVREKKEVTIFTGPPINRTDDSRVMQRLMAAVGKRVVCGGTSANIAARYLQTEVRTTLEYVDPDIPPIGYVDGIDLVTEGIRTLSRTLTLVKRYEQEERDASYYAELNSENGGAILAKLLLEDCTDLTLLVGKTINRAHHSTDFPYDVSIRMHLIRQLADVLERLGKKVTITYY